MSIYELYQSGKLDDAIKLGIVKTSIVYYCHIYKEFKTQRELGKNYNQSVIIVADKLCCSEPTVRRAVAVVI